MSGFLLGIHIVALWIRLVTCVEGLLVVRYYEALPHTCSVKHNNIHAIARICRTLNHLHL